MERRIDTTTIEGIKEAERLHQAGWITVRVTPWAVYMRAPECDAPTPYRQEG